MHLTDEGYLVCRDVPIARTGTQVYYEHEVPPLQGDSGGRVHVARDASEVFKPDSVATFHGKPICDDHPMEPVGPANWHELSIGYVSNPRQGDGANSDLLFADLIFTAQRGIDAVQSGKRAISVGYNAQYEQTAPGLGRQKDIHCNHVALVDEGRCGARCCIMDGKTVYTADLATDADYGEKYGPQSISVQTHAGTFHIRRHGEVERFREGHHNAELRLEAEFSRPEWLTDLPKDDIDFPDDEDIDYADAATFVESQHPRGPAGTHMGGKFVSAGASSGGSEASREAVAARQEQKGAQREGRFPTSKAQPSIGQKAIGAVKGFGAEESHILHTHFANLKPEHKGKVVHQIRAIGKALPGLLRSKFHEEKHHAIHAAHGLKALATGKLPNAQQRKGLYNVGARILMTGASVALGDPTGSVGHLAAAFGHEAVQHVLVEHALKTMVGAGSVAAQKVFGAQKDQEPGDLSDEDMALLQRFAEALADAIENYNPDEGETEDASWYQDIDFPFRDADTFEEGKHPRGGKGTSKGGQFVKKGTGSGGTERPQERTARNRESSAANRERQGSNREAHGKAVEAQKKGTEAAATAGKSKGQAEKERLAAWAQTQVGKLSKTAQRAFTGEPVPVKTQLTKQETGAIGEAVITNYLKQFAGLTDARPLNMQASNFPVDMIGDHELIEVKTGLVSNGKSAQKWRATIGQPSKTEAEWLKKAKPEVKAAWNQKKLQAIMDRKMAVLNEYKAKYGSKVRGKTVTAILNPDTKTADLYQYDGFHLHIRWNNDEAKKAYVGSFKY